MSSHTDDKIDAVRLYWRETFNCEPTPLERHLFKIAGRYLSPSDPYMFLFALVIHVCNVVYLDADRSFMADAAVSRGLAKQIRSDYEALSRVIPIFERRLEQLESLSDHTERQVQGWVDHNERLSLWHIKPEELPKLSFIVIVSLVAMVIVTAVLILTP